MSPPHSHHNHLRRILSKPTKPPLHHRHSLPFHTSTDNTHSSHSTIFSLTPHVLNSLISSCAKSASLSHGQQAHSATIKLGHHSNIFIATALVDFYSKCDRIFSAKQLFDEMPQRNEITWNSLISGYTHAQLPLQAIELFGDMVKLGFTPTPFTISSVLVCCAQLEAEELGVQLHGMSLKYGVSTDTVVGTILVDMYLKCMNPYDSRKCFDSMSERNVVTWTTMVSGYAQNGKLNEAMLVVREMQRSGVQLNKVTCNSLLSSFSCPSDLFNGEQVHCLVIREGFETDNYIVASLLSMYSECGCLESFCKISPFIATDDQVSWNAVIAGFSHLGKGQEALDWFKRMRNACIAINFFTLTHILKAIGMLSASEEGKQIHAYVLKTGYVSDVYAQNGLVAMYARCGAINDSRRVFSSISKPDMVSWNSLLSGCAQHGYGEDVVELFEKMRSKGIKPDHSTFLSVLTACSHVGLVEQGLHYFGLIREASMEPPRIEHYACVVDLLSRAGYLCEAESFINNMPIRAGPSVFKALLSACRVHGNVDIATRSAKKLLDLWPDDPGTYILLSSVFADSSYWNDAAGMRKLMCERGMRKKPGHSWIEVNKMVPFH